jgi:hypothetical protein
MDLKINQVDSGYNKCCNIGLSMRVICWDCALLFQKKKLKLSSKSTYILSLYTQDVGIILLLILKEIKLITYFQIFKNDSTDY